MRSIAHRLLLAAALGLSATSLHARPLSGKEAHQIDASVEALRPQLTTLATDIWNYAEVGFKENRSSAELQKALRDAGFDIKTGISGIPTAFVASAGHGGPVIALLAEYDALPGLSQSRDAEAKSLGGIAGHACGHNLLGAASVTAAIALKAWLEENHVKGTIRLYGSPAEEGGFSKVYFVRDGLFKDVDTVLSWHPGDANDASPSQLLSVITGKFRFKGIASHAAVAPERGRSALDAVEIHDVATNFLREHVPDGTRIQYVISDGGDQPNIVPAHAESFYYVRNYDPAVTQSVWERVKNAADGAALATGTSVSVEVIGGSYGDLPNDVLGHVVDANLRRVGGYRYTGEETTYAARISATLPKGSDRVTPDTIAPYSTGRKIPASSDVGDISWTVPTAALSTATWVSGTVPHSWQAASASGNTIGLKGAELAAKTLALTGAQLFLSPDVIAAAKAELISRQGPSFAYKPMLGDRTPPLNYTSK